MGFEGFGYMAYSATTTRQTSNGISHVWRTDRDLQRLKKDFTFLRLRPRCGLSAVGLGVWAGVSACVC